MDVAGRLDWSETQQLIAWKRCSGYILDCPVAVAMEIGWICKSFLLLRFDKLLNYSLPPSQGLRFPRDTVFQWRFLFVGYLFPAMAKFFSHCRFFVEHKMSRLQKQVPSMNSCYGILFASLRALRTKWQHTHLIHIAEIYSHYFFVRLMFLSTSVGSI